MDPELLEGVGPALADRLDEVGYTTLEEIAHANALELAKVKGASPDLISDAQEILADRDMWSTRNLVRDVQRACICRHCGKEFQQTTGGAVVATHRRRCPENPDSPDRFH